MSFRQRIRAVSLFVVIGAQSVLAQQQQSPSALPQMSDAAIWRSFSSSIADYVKLRDRIREELPGLTVTDKPAELVAASDALARAIERADPKASQGRFFTPQTAAEFRRRIDAYARTHDMTSILAPIPEERPTVGGFNVYSRFPMSSPLPSMPPGLLAQLPSLPPALEYRLVGRVLILRDSDASLVLDYLPNAVSAIK